MFINAGVKNGSFWCGTSYVFTNGTTGEEK
jgi:hypothetical protein